MEGHEARGRAEAARRHDDVWVTWCQRGGIREVVSGLPAPPLGEGGIGEGGSEQPRRLPRVPGMATNTAISPDVKGRHVGV